MIHSQNLITTFVLFFNRWYLLKTVIVVLFTTYVTVVMVADRISVVIILEFMGIRKYYRMCRWCPMMISDIVSALSIPHSP